MSRRTILVGCAVAGLLGLAALPASADVHADEPWQGIDTGPGPYGPDVPRSPSAHTTVVDASTADVTWVAGEANSELGTSLETANLGMDVAAGDTISVDYELLDGASPATTAVRLFVYYKPNADSLHEAPCATLSLERWDCQVSAPDDGTTSGTLSFPAPADGTIGTAGLVYDTSNGGVEGTVRFTDLTVGEEHVSFLPAPAFVVPEAPTATDQTCDRSGIISIPDVEGVTYVLGEESLESGANQVEPGDHTVDAVPDEGYTFESEHSWTLTVAPADDCETPKSDDDETPAPGDEATQVADDGTSLPETGVGASPLTFVGGGLLLAGGALAFGAYRRRHARRYAGR